MSYCYTFAALPWTSSIAKSFAEFKGKGENGFKTIQFVKQRWGFFTRKRDGVSFYKYYIDRYLF